MKLGVHVSAAGGLDRAVERARRLGCTAFQVFVKSSRQWEARMLGDDEIRRFREARGRRDRWPAFAHASYLLNLASDDRDLWERSSDTCALELERCHQLGLDGLVVHPGAHRGQGASRGRERVARAVERILEAVPDGPPLLLECTAGQGTTLGARLEDLAWLSARGGRRLGVCLDTCHLHAAGYRLDGAPRVRETLDAIATILGFRTVQLWHLNGSRAPAGGRRDRHTGIGEGTIGFAGFRALLQDRRVRARPGILETPKGDSERLDRLNLARVRALLNRKRLPRER